MQCSAFALLALACAGRTERSASGSSGSLCAQPALRRAARLLRALRVPRASYGLLHARSGGALRFFHVNPL